MSSTRSVPPPSHQEVTRKLSVHASVKPSVKKPNLPSVAVSGTESDSDSVFTPDAVVPSPMSTASISGAATSIQPPLSSIAERRSQSGGEESEEDEDDEDGGWRTQDVPATQRGSHDESVIKVGYLWKKGERRKTWKKRWFVLRPAHLAFYKTSAEYKLHRLLDLTDVHSCTPVVLKKHVNTFGIVSPTRTFYLQAESAPNVREWVSAINDARTALITTSTRNSVSSPPIPIPTTLSTAGQVLHQSQLSSSPSRSPHTHQLTSSESDDASPYTKTPVVSPPPAPGGGEVPSPSKPVLSGYLMKCGSRRNNWHKRWFVLSGEKLIYSRSHMDTKPHREIPISFVIDALEYQLPANRNHPALPSPSPVSPQIASGSSPEDVEGAGSHTFKIVTTKRTLLLCAPSEEEEIGWLSAIRALIARRSGQGVLPGEPHAGVSASAPANAGGASVISTGPMQRRRDSIVRRLSLSSGGSPFAGSGAGGGVGSATTAGVQQQEASSERQS